MHNTASIDESQWVDEAPKGKSTPIPSPGDRPLRIVFMGTPDFAVGCLQTLIDGPNEVLAVVAQPDKPAGRGKKLKSPPTIELAKKHGIRTMQPRAIRSGRFPKNLAAMEADLFVVVAYGRILTQAILDMPKLGCINVHASLLPDYRGAGPIQRAILEGDGETGITTMLMDLGMDTGDMLRMVRTPIAADETAQSLHDRLAQMGPWLLDKTLKHLKAGTLERVEQVHEKATHAPMLNKADGRIDWTRPAQEIDWHIRGMYPWPGAFTQLGSKRMVILGGKPLDEAATGPAGTLEALKAGLKVNCGHGAYLITEVKPAGKRAMSAQAFLAGHPLQDGAHFGDPA